MEGSESVTVKGKRWEKKLCRITYTSTLLTEDSEEAERMIQEILDVSLKNNPSLRIGGMMYFSREMSSDHIVQVLEGPVVYVKPLYEKIKADSRHTDVKTLLYEDKFKKRKYKEWGMMQSKRADWDHITDILPTYLEWQQKSKVTTKESNALLGENEPLFRYTLFTSFVGTSLESQTSECKAVIRSIKEECKSKLVGGFIHCELQLMRIFVCIEGCQSVVQSIVHQLESDEKLTTMKIIRKEAAPKRFYAPEMNILWEDGKKSNVNKRLYEYLPDNLIEAVKEFDGLDLLLGDINLWM